MCEPGVSTELDAKAHSPAGVRGRITTRHLPDCRRRCASPFAKATEERWRARALSLATIRQPPIRVNLRTRNQDRAGSLVVRKNQSCRDLTKVAQYEVLG
jgi:hypothetical protein